jgi:hypothetical protein
MMSRINAMNFPPDIASIDDVVADVQAVRAQGADLKVDGWSISILRASKLPSAMIEHVRNHREAYIYHFIVVCPTPCESCWGVGVRQHEDEAWFCTAHYPDSPAKEALWRLAKALTRDVERCTEYRAQDDYDEEVYRQMLDDHQRRGDLLAQMWRDLEPRYPSTL